VSEQSRCVSASVRCGVHSTAKTGTVQQPGRLPSQNACCQVHLHISVGTQPLWTTALWPEAASHLSISTVSATSMGFHWDGSTPLSTPLAGPTVMETLIKFLRSSSSDTMRWRASGVRGAAPGSKHRKGGPALRYNEDTGHLRAEQGRQTAAAHA
jgi:hypothetical protein